MAKRTENNKVCNCDQYCLRSICVSSDSGLMVKNCWCAECADRRDEIAENYENQIIVIKTINA